MTRRQVSQESAQQSPGLRLRSLPPAGDFASPSSIVDALRQLRQTGVSTGTSGGASLLSFATDGLIAKYPADSVLWTGSGTAALYHLFCACKKIIPDLELGLAAYTCPQIASAAIRANVRVRLLDIDPQTLQILPQELETPPSVVVLSNLYGLPDSVDTRLLKCGLVIDDACQAMLSQRDGYYVGCLPGTLGVASFGRGKSLSGLGAGAIVASSTEATVSNAICSVLKELHCLDLSADALGRGPNGLALWVQAIAYWVFGSPWLYGIPAALPFLGLGETVVDLDFPVKSVSPLQLLGAVAQSKRWAEYRARRCENAERWNEILSDYELISPIVVRGLDVQNEVVPLRYPVICQNTKQRERLFLAFSKAGLGVSKSYPKPMSAYAELQSAQLSVGRTAGAQIVADRILTLPVHGGISDKDFLRAKVLLKRLLG